MWNEKPLLFDDEDETALRARFVELWAKYQDRSIIEIGNYIFKDLRSPDTRGAQWAVYWSKELDVLEEVKRLRQGQVGGEVASKEEIINSAWAIAHDAQVDAKDKVNALKLIAEMQGMIEKNINKKTEDVKRRQMPTIVFERYAD